MKLLAPLSRSSQSIERYSFSDWVNQFNQIATFSVGGQTYTLPVQTTMPGQRAETIANSFIGYVAGGYMGNGVIFGLTATRLRVFSEARFQFQNFNKGRPADLYGTSDLDILEHPWPGGTTGDMLALALLHADFAGNAYIVNIDRQLVFLRPDWTSILLAERKYVDGVGQGGTVGYKKAGYSYWHGGKESGVDPVLFLPEEVAHFAPMPDPLASYRGMSWLTPVIREIQADGAATSHKLAFFENAATPNLAVSMHESITPEQFEAFVEKMDDDHQGIQNAYKTLYLAGGADATVIGSNLQQLDFKVTQGAGETRLAQAAGVPPTVAMLSEGLQGASLNAGNFGQARRQFGDITMAHLWRNIAGSLEVLVPPPAGVGRLWYDARDIAFLREDQKDLADIQTAQAHAMRQLIDAGWEPSSVVAAITGNDYSLLTHTGLFSIQLQEAGAPKLPAKGADPAASPAK